MKRRMRIRMRKEETGRLLLSDQGQSMFSAEQSDRDNGRAAAH